MVETSGSKITAGVVRRAAIAKYLAQRGFDQASRPDPLAGLGVLALHDATEIFLQALAEHMNIGGKKEFMAFWEILPNLPMKESMSRLNKTRVVLKHQAILPSGLEARDLASLTRDFLARCAKQFLQLEFEKISLVDLLPQGEPRRLLVSAWQEEERKNHWDALRLAGEALRAALRVGSKGEMPFSLVGYEGPVQDAEAWEEALDQVTKEVERELAQVHEELNILALGVDYSRHRKFQKILSKYSAWGPGRQLSLSGDGPPEPTSAEVAFSVDFAAEVALVLAGEPGAAG